MERKWWAVITVASVIVLVFVLMSSSGILLSPRSQLAQSTGGPDFGSRKVITETFDATNNTFHLECVNSQCMNVAGAGVNQCGGNTFCATNQSVLPDLFISTIGIGSPPSNSACPQGKSGVKISASVGNNGVVAPSIPHRTLFIASDNQSVESAEDGPALPVQPGSFSVDDAVFCLFPGSYGLTIFADNTNSIIESNEINNFASQPITMPINFTGNNNNNTNPANIAPEASFLAVPSSGSAPLFVSFDGNSSFDIDGFITNYVWNFGDGGNTVLSSPFTTTTHTYNTPGNFFATLTVTDNEGAIDSASRIIIVTGTNSTNNNTNSS